MSVLIDSFIFRPHNHHRVLIWFNESGRCGNEVVSKQISAGLQHDTQQNQAKVLHHIDNAQHVRLIIESEIDVKSFISGEFCSRGYHAEMQYY